MRVEWVEEIDASTTEYLYSGDLVKAYLSSYSKMCNWFRSEGIIPTRMEIKHQLNNLNLCWRTRFIVEIDDDNKVALTLRWMGHDAMGIVIID